MLGSFLLKPAFLSDAYWKMRLFPDYRHLAVAWSARATSISSFQWTPGLQRAQSCIAGDPKHSYTHFNLQQKSPDDHSASWVRVLRPLRGRVSKTEQDTLNRLMFQARLFQVYNFLVVVQHTGKQHERENPENCFGWEADKLPACLTLRKAALLAMNSCPH